MVIVLNSFYQRETIKKYSLECSNLFSRDFNYDDKVFLLEKFFSAEMNSL